MDLYCRMTWGKEQDKIHFTPGFTQSRRRGPCVPSPIFGLKKLLKLPQLWDLLDPRALREPIFKVVSNCSQHLGTLGDRVAAGLSLNRSTCQEP